jgi:hypothetical protein
LSSEKLENAMNAFRKWEIHPYDASIFDDHDFIPQHEPVHTEQKISIAPATEKTYS